MDIRDAYRRAMDGFGERVHAVKADEWNRPTPCEEWDIRALLHHVVYGNLWASELYAGKTVAEVGDRFDGDLLGSDLVAAFDASSTAVVRAVTANGALDRKVHVSFADITGREYLPQLFLDVLIHSWDLARAIGADERLDPELVSLGAEWFAEREGWYREGAVGPRVDVPAGADPQTRLLGAFGRAR